MPINLSCVCGRKLAISEEHAGMEGRCPACGATLTIPRIEEASLVGDPFVPSRPVGIAVDTPPPEAEPRDEQPGTDSDRRFPGLPPLPWEDREQDRALHVPGYKLFAPAAVALGALFGTFFGGAVLLAVNYVRLGRKGAAASTILAALALLAGCVALLMNTAIEPFRAALAVHLVTVPVVYLAARLLQSGWLSNHLRRNGAKSSFGEAAGIGILCGFAAVLAVGAYASRYHGLGEREEFGPQEEVYYKHGATRADALRIGQTLKKSGYFDGRRGKSVQVRKEGGRYVVAFVVVEGTWNNRDQVRIFSFLGGDLPREALGGAPVAVELCDQQLRKHKSIDPIDRGQRMEFTGGEEIWYGQGVTAEQARRFGEGLRRAGYFNGASAKTVQLRAEAGGYVIALVVREGLWDNEDTVRGAESMIREIGREVFPAGPQPVPMWLELCDQVLAVRKTVPLHQAR